MSVEGKKIAVKRALDEATANFLAALSKIESMALPVWITIAQATSAAAIAKSQFDAVINTPADYFKDDGTVKPYKPKEGEFIVGEKK